ncbi:MAG: D-alanyl-D-alanine carboxypeptidase family protein, partial [Selenomonadaceae bacterium]|nr:D-alanyl-D-alanine carboxypeptidase family protein [Selenomonadaceae bacterium]
MKFVSEIPKPLFDINEILPNGITPNLNGRLPADKLKQLHCGGYLYVDAARSWLAMVRAALADGIFLNLNFVIDAYRTVAAQLKRFKQRFEKVDTTITPPPQHPKFQVEFNGKTWQLKDGQKYAEIPGQSWHGYGLAVWIRNAVEPAVKTWLDEHAAEFGFVRAFEGNLREYVYIKARDEIPARVLEIEKLPPEPNFSAEEVAEASGCTWFEPPPEGWTCHGLFHEEPFKPGYLAVVDQGAGFGISPNVLTFSFKQCAGIICIDPQPFAKYNRPMLVTSNPQETVKKLAAAFDKKQSDKAAVSKISTSTADKNHSDKVAVAETSTPTVDKKQFDKAAVNASTSNADKQQFDKATVAEIPKPLFDIKEFLPNGITPNLNGIIHPNFQRKVHCGGWLYIDTARSWLAMVRA